MSLAPDTLAAPFPYIGGKSSIAGLVWSRLGNCENYVEPFAGSCAALLGRPHPPRLETVNDADGLLANAWRAIRADPEATAYHADWPVSECDLHARHAWLVGQRESLSERLMGDPDWFDAKAAGWWVWGACCWIGSGWCSGKGPWVQVDGRLVKREGEDQAGAKLQRIHLGDAGMGVHRKRVHLGDAGMGVHRKRVRAWDAGITRQTLPENGIPEWFAALSARLRRVRICCGDWSRVCGPTPTLHGHNGICGVFLDPPYSHAERDSGCYAVETDCSAAVREWAIEQGQNPRMRIALCGYDTEHAMPGGWECVRWKAHGGYGSQGNGRGRANATREAVWFSPFCARPAPTLFDGI